MTPGTLPPLGGDSTGIAEFVDALVRECFDDPKRQAWDQQVDQSMNLYIGSHWQSTPDDGLLRLVVNRVQNCIVSLVAVQAGDPPKIEFVARERGEPPLVFVNTNSAEGLALAATLGVDTTQPLPADVAKSVLEQAKLGDMAKLAGGAVGGLTSDAVVEVSDATAAEALQTVFDGMWDESDCQTFFVENVLNKNILGWQPTLYEFDDIEKKHVLTNVNPRQVFVDRLHSDLSRMQYAIYDEPISVEEAVALYPHMADRVREAGSTGVLKFPGSRQYTPAGDLESARFDRGMVVIRHAWVRNQPFPMSQAEAVQSGAAIVREAPQPDGTIREVTEVGGVEVALGSPAWPMRYGIRQIKILFDGVVEDRECETADIPLPINVNVPIPFSPYGQGEPTRLQGLQSALNRIVSCIVTHHAYNAFPPEYVAQGIIDAMGKALRDVRTRPGSRIVVPDHLITQLGDIRKILMTGETPSMPADVWRVLDFLVSMIDKEGNQSDVMQGNASASWSGETVNALQNAASQVIRGKSLYTEIYLRRLARLMVHSIHTRMTPDDWSRYCGKWPMQALAALQSRAKAIDIDFSVNVRSGSGSSRRDETNALIAASQSGAPISPQTVLGRLDLDPDVEMRNTIQWQREVAAAMPQPVAASEKPKENTDG